MGIVALGTEGGVSVGTSLPANILLRVVGLDVASAVEAVGF